MTEWHVREGVSHPDAPGQTFCTVDGGSFEHRTQGTVEHDTRHLPDFNAAMHFLVGNKLKFGDRIYVDGDFTEGRELVIDKAFHGTRLCFDVKGVGLPEGVTELFNPEDLILWLTNVLRPGDIVAYLDN
jgi:hypothetical protein